MTDLQTVRPGLGTGVRPSAAAWIDGRHAIVARLSVDGSISTCEIGRGSEPELSYLALVIGAIGDRERVLILGPGSMRLALERAYVATYRHSDRPVDVERAGRMDRESLVDRLRQLAA